MVWWGERWGDVGPRTTWLGHPLRLNQAACAWWLQYLSYHWPLGEPKSSPHSDGVITAKPLPQLVSRKSRGPWQGASPAFLAEFWLFDPWYPLVPSSSWLKSFLRGCRNYLTGQHGDWKEVDFGGQLWIQTLLLLCPSWGILKDWLTAPSLSFCTCKMAIPMLAF